MSDPTDPRPATDPAAPTADNTVSRSDEPSEPSEPYLTGPEEPKFASALYAGEVGTFGRYRVLKKLGQGGMGAVYLGYDASLERKIALKVMLPRFAASAEAKGRFLREARSAAKVKSDHVVTIYEVNEERGVPFIAMEYLLGTPLDQFLKTKGNLGLPQALRVVWETALGLSAAHELGLIHRDIKPANLWLEAPKGRVKLLDFGLARPANDDAHLTDSGAVMGTPAYMSPEQGRGHKVDHRTDLFSLGVLLYRLTTGKMPFTGDSTMAVLTSLAVDTPTPPRQLNPEMSEALEAVITRLLEKNPAERFQTAREVLEALAAVENPRSGSGPLPVVVATPVQPIVVGAQTQNVWEGIEDSGSQAVPLATDSEPTAAPRTRPERTAPKWPAVLAVGVLVAAVAGLVAVLSWKKPEVAEKPADPPPPEKKSIGTGSSNKPPEKKEPPAEGKVYPIPADLIGSMTPVKPEKVFSLDHLDPNNPKHIPPEEKFPWQPKETVAVLGSHRQRVPGGNANWLGVSPDGKTVWAGQHSPSQAFDISTGKPLDVPLLACFLPDGKLGASGNKVYDLADLKKPPVEYANVGGIAAFLTNDIVLATGGDGYVAWKLDPKESKVLENFLGVSSFAVSNDRKYLAVALKDESCHVYDLTPDGPKKKFVLPGVEGKVRTPNYAGHSISFSDTGLLVTLDSEGVVRVWDITGPAPQLRYTIDAKKERWDSVLLFPKGDRLIRANQGVFEVWSVEGKEPQRIASSPGYVLAGSDCGAIAVTPDGNTIITGHGNGAVRFWGIEKGVIFERNPIRPQSRLQRFADFSPDGRFAELYHEDRRVHVWDLAELQSRVLDWTHDGIARFAPDSTTLCSWRYAVGGNGLRLIPVADQPGTPPVDFGNDLYPACYSPNGKWLAACSAKELAIWDVSISPPKELWRVPGLAANFWRFTPDGRYLIAANAKDGAAKIWAMTASGPKLRQELTLPSMHFALSPDGKTAVISHTAHQLKHYELKDGVLSFVRALPGAPNSLWADFSPDGRTILMGDSAGLKLLDAATGQVVREWPLRGQPLAGRFHPDGRHIFVTNADRTTYVLRLPKEVLDWKPAAALNLGAALAFDGKRSHVRLPFAPTDAHPYTVEAWVKFDAPTSEAYSVVACAFNPARGISLYRTPPGELRFGERVGQGQDTAGELKSAGHTGWVHVAGVWDGKSSRVYVNGVKQPHIARGELPQKQIDTQDQPWMLGATNPVFGEPVRSFFAGQMREVRFTRGARYDADFTPALRHEPDKDTYALYRCDDGQGDELKDTSGGNRHGKIVGARWVAADPDRAAAEWVFSVGGRVYVNGEPKYLGAAAELPKERFTLTGVFLGNIKVPDASLALFKDFNSLTYLSLQGTSVSDAGLAHFKNCRQLVYINLGSTAVTDAGLAHLKDNPNLCLLYLSRTQVSDAGLAHFRQCKPLAGLDVRQTKVTAAAIAEFTKALPKCRIQHDGGTLGPADPDRAAAEAALALGGTVSVNGKPDVVKVAAELPKEPFALTAADFKDKNVTDADLAPFKDCKNLTGLNLNHTAVTDAGLAHLKDCKNLTGLDLTKTRVGDAGLAHLKDRKNMTLLQLYGTQVTDAGLAHVQGWKSLAHLGLFGTKIGDAGLARLKDCKDLQYLDVRQTKVTATAIAEFAQAMPQCRIAHDGGTIEPKK